MDARMLDKADLATVLERLAQTRRLIAPVEDRTGAAFASVDEVAAIRLDYRNTSLSAKEIVFPQTEPLLVFRDGAAEERIPAAPGAVLFGVRPCDARSLTMLDAVFRGGETEDPYYAARRDELTVVALTCNEPGPTCFCTSVGGSPDDGSGADVLATDLDDGLLLRAITDRGEVLLGELDAGRPAEDGEIEAARDLAARAAERMENVPVPTDAAALLATFDSDLWSDLAAGCIGCGACTYACPTCHCFDITDEQKRGTGHRVRSWDACTFPLFTLHGSGHNPRPTATARLRQRVLHKFSYCPENFGEAFCVGCGRCVVHCPSGIDIRRILARLDAVLTANSEAGGPTR